MERNVKKQKRRTLRNSILLKQTTESLPKLITYTFKSNSKNRKGESKRKYEQKRYSFRDFPS